jgi:hypothetical protein
MKTDADNKIPFSPAALTVLDRVAALNMQSDLIFVGPDGAALSGAAMSAVIKRMNKSDGQRWVEPRQDRSPPLKLREGRRPVVPIAE